MTMQKDLVVRGNTLILKDSKEYAKGIFNFECQYLKIHFFLTFRIFRSSNEMSYIPLSANEGRTYLSRFNVIAGRVIRQVYFQSAF